MALGEGNLILYGICGIEDTLESIVSNLNIMQLQFEIKLIMMEAITNAFIHGNNSDIQKPIGLQYELNNNELTIKVTDCGEGVEKILIPDEIKAEDILNETGKGLFLINYYSDEVELKGNSVIIKKYINNEVLVLWEFL